MKSQEAQSRGRHNFARGPLYVAVLLACGNAGAADPPGGPTTDSVAQTYLYAKGRILLQTKAGLSDKELDKLIKPHGGRRGDRLQGLDVHIIELPPQASEIAVAKALKHHPHVKFAELDEQVTSALQPNDTYYSRAWHLPLIGAPTTWDTNTGTGITVAILDTGVDGTHPELSPHMVPGWNFYDNNSNTADVTGHGTMVAGIVAATTNNGVGVAGLSFNSKIMPIRISDTSGYAYYSTMAQAITWAADHGAKVANLSFGGAGSSTVHTAAQYLRGKGGVVVMSAGNTSGLLTETPSDYVTVVSATDSTDAKTSWSSYGNYVDIAAPGINIPTTSRGGTYSLAWGTSMAAPIISATYAMMLTANGQLSPTTLDKTLFSTALDLGAAGYDQYFGWGRVRNDAAVSKAKTAINADSQAPVTSITTPVGGSKVGGLVTVDASATDNIGVTKVELYAGTTLIATDTTSPYGFVWDSTKTADGSVALQTKAYDGAGNVGKSTAVSVTVSNDLTPPTATITNPVAGSTVSGTVTISVAGQDNKKVAKISLLIDGKEVAMTVCSDLSCTMSYAWSVPATSTRKKNSSTTLTSSRITAQVYDAANNMGSASVTVSR